MSASGHNNYQVSISLNGNKYWYKGILVHRDNDLPAIEWSSGGKEWRSYGILHRESRDENGNTLPAAIWSDGTQEWWMNGKRYRENGLPTIVYADGSIAFT